MGQFFNAEKQGSLLIEDIPRSGPAFNASGHHSLAVHATAHDSQNKTKAVALVIDLQSFDGMGREDALAFSRALGQQVTEFRQAGIEPVWVAIAPGGSKLLQPLTGNHHDASHRDLLVLEEMGFTGHQPQFSNSDIYAAFINQFGPRDNEVVYRKPSMSALVTMADVHERDSILKWAGTKLESQRSDEDHPDTRYIQAGEEDSAFAGFFPEALALDDYLKAQKVTDTHILGTVSQYCVAETAITSATKGYSTRIHEGLVLSWQYPVNGSSRDKGTLVWAGFDHQGLIKDALSGALHDPARSFSADQKAQIEAITIGDTHLTGAATAPVLSQSKIPNKTI